MKKIKATPVMFLQTLAALSGICILLNMIGYRFVAIFDFVPYIYSAALLVLLTKKAMENREDRSKLTVLCASVLPLLGFFFAVCSLSTNFWFFLIHFMIIQICCLIQFFSYVSHVVLKAIVGTIYVLCVTVIFGFVLIFLPFLLIGKTTVIQSELSPNAVYLVEIIDDDQGALGGNTCVRTTRKDQDISLLIGVLQKKPVTIYRGHWGEGFSMDLRWASDTILYINEERYELP